MNAFVFSVASILKERLHEDPFLILPFTGLEMDSPRLLSARWRLCSRSYCRDMSLWYSSLRSKHVASLRHAPVLGATLVFPPGLVCEVSESRKKDIKSKALFKAATARTSAPKQSSSFSGPTRQPKSQSSGADKVLSPKRSRSSGPSKKTNSSTPQHQRQAATSGKPKGQTNR